MPPAPSQPSHNLQHAPPRWARWLARTRLLLASALGLALGLGVGLGLASCGRGAGAGGSGQGEGSKLRVVATIGMIADVARTIGGDRAQVGSLIGPGVDPHLHAPTRSDIDALTSADVVLYNGLLLEGKLVEALRRAQQSGRRVVAVAERVPASVLLGSSEEHGGSEPSAASTSDPHLWMDPSAWSLVVGVVRDELIAADPEGRDAFTENARTLQSQIAQLEAYAQDVLASVPAGARVLVTAHDAFNYFGRRFGFDVVGIQGISTESEAGVRDIERLVDLLVERKVPAVFVESTVSDRNVRALIDGAAAKGHRVVVGGELFSDAMGAAGTYEGTYLGMIDHNVTTIARALGGEAPSGGWQGRLGSRGGGSP